MVKGNRWVRRVQKVSSRRLPSPRISAVALTVCVAAWVAWVLPTPACGTSCGPVEEWVCSGGGGMLEDRCDVNQTLCRWAICNENPDHIICDIQIE